MRRKETLSQFFRRAEARKLPAILGNKCGDILAFESPPKGLTAPAQPPRAGEPSTLSDRFAVSAEATLGDLRHPTLALFEIADGSDHLHQLRRQAWRELLGPFPEVEESLFAATVVGPLLCVQVVHGGVRDERLERMRPA